MARYTSVYYSAFSANFNMILHKFGQISGQFKLRIPKSLRPSLARHAKRKGISMNQYCMYLLSKNDAAAARSSNKSR